MTSNNANSFELRLLMWKRLHYKDDDGNAQTQEHTDAQYMQQQQHSDAMTLTTKDTAATFDVLDCGDFDNLVEVAAIEFLNYPQPQGTELQSNNHHHTNDDVIFKIPYAPHKQVKKVGNDDACLKPQKRIAKPAAAATTTTTRNNSTLSTLSSQVLKPLPISSPLPLKQKSTTSSNVTTMEKSHSPSIPTVVIPKMWLQAQSNAESQQQQQQLPKEVEAEKKALPLHSESVSTQQSQTGSLELSPTSTTTTTTSNSITDEQLCNVLLEHSPTFQRLVTEMDVNKLQAFMKSSKGVEKFVRKNMSEVAKLIEVTDGTYVTKNGTCKTTFKNRKVHSENDIPALVQTRLDGTLQTEAWYTNGVLNRDGGKPAHIEYNANGRCVLEKYYRNGQLHRSDGLPTVIDKTHGIVEHHENGKLHRVGMPAYIDRNKCVVKYYWNGMLHNTGNYPAVINYNTGAMEYYSHNVLHRVDGPAVINANNDRKYYNWGKLTKHEYSNGDTYTFDTDGRLHSQFGIPSIRVTTKNDKHYVVVEHYHTHGKLHRKGQPAVVTTHYHSQTGEVLRRIITYYQHGLKHRIGGPAHQDSRGNVAIHYENGVIHRSGGLPAYIKKDEECYEWLENGQLHRKNGPAIIKRLRNEELYYLHGILQPNPNTSTILKSTSDTKQT
jgi:antitoxin component YwqK of YwqJK toxin-antitoxin module